MFRKSVAPHARRAGDFGLPTEAATKIGLTTPGAPTDAVESTCDFDHCKQTDARREYQNLAYGAAREAMVFYTLTATCRLRVDPQACFRDVLLRLPKLRAERVSELYPTAGWLRIRRMAWSSAPPSPRARPRRNASVAPNAHASAERPSPPAQPIPPNDATAPRQVGHAPLANVCISALRVNSTGGFHRLPNEERLIAR